MESAAAENEGAGRDADGEAKAGPSETTEETDASIGGGEPMELEEPLRALTPTEPDSGADTAPTEDLDPPDQSEPVKEARQENDVASSDDVTEEAPPAISSSTAEMSDLPNVSISSSEVDESQASDSMPSTSSNVDGDAGHITEPVRPGAVTPSESEKENVSIESEEEQPDTSAHPTEESAAPIRKSPDRIVPIVNSTPSRAAVSSSDAITGTVHHLVSSTNAELPTGDESAVSSSMNSNGNAINSVGTHDAADALATLASAAMNRQQSTKDTKADLEEPWYTVGIVRGTSYTVSNYIADPNIDLSKLSLETLPDLSCYPLKSLEPGTGYKFRIAAINSCGRGEFGEESAFKTCVPGYPGAPSAIKISKSSEGAHLSWEPPQVSSDGIFEYSVYLAVKPNGNMVKDPVPAKSQLTFVRVYCGKANTCIVPQVTLGNAHVDNSTKPAIIFRIAARNDKGYGPATQVRWLQENKTSGTKRILADSRPPGAPPSKQQKPNTVN